jgi:hypothetical protein
LFLFNIGAFCFNSPPAGEPRAIGWLKSTIQEPRLLDHEHGVGGALMAPTPAKSACQARRMMSEWCAVLLLDAERAR